MPMSLSARGGAGGAGGAGCALVASPGRARMPAAAASAAVCCRKRRRGIELMLVSFMLNLSVCEKARRLYRFLRFIGARARSNMAGKDFRIATGGSMQSYEISEDRWIGFFDEFSRDHTGWPATIEILSKESGPQRLASELAFQGISFERSGT